VPAFGRGVWLTGFRVAVLPDVLGGTGSDCARAVSLPGRMDGVTGQAGAGRAHSRCQQARKAFFLGQVRLIFRTRARAWRTSRVGNAHSRRSVPGSASLRSPRSYRPSSRHQADRLAAMFAARTQPQFTIQVFDDL
jgi:hypothetical protein